jgi:DNA-binding response OmpR family regulator
VTKVVTKAVERRRTPSELWRAGRMSSPDRLLVLLVCSRAELDQLRAVWVGQAIDIHHRENTAGALVVAGQAGPDIVVIGETSGPLDATDFVSALREVGNDTPVIVGFPKEHPETAAAVLEAGATAVVQRPFSPEALLRLMDSSTPRDGAFHVRPLPLDLGRLRVDGASARIWIDGQESLLPAMEYMLLRYLAERHGQIVSREELSAVGWGRGASVPSNSLTVHLTRLRRRFPTDPGEEWLRTIRGIGYQFIVPGRTLAQAAGTG